MLTDSSLSAAISPLWSVFVRQARASIVETWRAAAQPLESSTNTIYEVAAKIGSRSRDRRRVSDDERFPR